MTIEKKRHKTTLNSSFLIFSLGDSGGSFLFVFVSYFSVPRFVILNMCAPYTGWYIQVLTQYAFFFFFFLFRFLVLPVWKHRGRLIQHETYSHWAVFCKTITEVEMLAKSIFPKLFNYGQGNLLKNIFSSIIVLPAPLQEPIASINVKHTNSLSL